MLRSTFYGFNIAFSGLMKSQKALDLTGNNISNVNTPGFTRQRLDLVSFPSSNYTDRYAPYNNIAIGQGVNVTRVSQIRDPFLDARFRREASNLGELDSHLSVLKDISRIFDEVQFDALNKALADFRSQLQVYSNQTGEAMIDTTVWAAAEAIVKMFNQYSNQLSEVREYNEFLLRESAVPEVNKIMENLAMLNKNIRECEIYGNPALELRDQRNLLLDQLSAYMKIEVKYEKDPDPILAQMGVEVCKVTFIGDKNNQVLGNQEAYTLVDGHEYVSLGTEKDPLTGLMRIYKATDLKGNIVTDGTGRQFYYGPSLPAEDPPASGNFLYALMPNGVNSQLFLAYDGDDSHPLNGKLALAFDHPDNPLGVNLYYGPGDPVLDKDGNSVTANGMQLFYASTDSAINSVPADTDSEGLLFIGGALKGALEMLNSKGAFNEPEANTLNGIGYYESVLDRIVRDFAEMMNEANKYVNPMYASYWSNGEIIAAWNAYWSSVGGSKGDPYSVDPIDLEAFFTDYLADPDVETTLTLGDLMALPEPQFLDDRPLFTAINSTLPMSASNIQIATGWKNGTYNLTTSKNISVPGQDFTGDTSNLLYIISLLDKKFDFTTQGVEGFNDTGGARIYKGSFDEMFKNIGLIAAQDAKSRDMALQANTNVILGIEDMRNALSSVSMDEEGVNLLRFQKSYAANARVMTTLDEALDVLINRLGIVGR